MERVYIHRGPLSKLYPGIRPSNNIHIPIILNFTFYLMGKCWLPYEQGPVQGTKHIPITISRYVMNKRITHMGCLTSVPKQVPVSFCEHKLYLAPLALIVPILV